MERAELEMAVEGSDSDLVQRIDWVSGSVEVRSPERKVLMRVRHYLVADQTPERRGDQDLQIRALVDQQFASRIGAELLGHPTESFAAYVDDPWEFGHVAGCRAWARRKPWAEPIVVEVAPRCLLLAARKQDEVARSTVRLVREALRTELALRGAITLHASCASGKSLGGALFVGPSGSGKTTLALALARTGSLASGDQTELIRGPGATLHAFGFPWAISISPHGLWSAGVDLSSVQTELVVQAGVEKIEFTPFEASRIVGVGLAAEVPIDTVVVIDSKATEAGPMAQVCDLAQCADGIRREMREPDPAFPTFWLAPDCVPDAATYSDLAHALRDSRIVRLSWDPSRHRASEALGTIERSI
jgi:energy-coupling factor transporter ATP-binding protein EcfA2